MVNPIVIAFACDEGYSKHVGVVMQSILANATMADRHEFHILTMNLSLDAENRLLEIATRGKATILVHRIDASLLAGFPTGSLPLETYLRLLLPDLLPEHEKILYLDADLIVMDSLSKLWNFSIGTNAIGATIDTIAILKGAAILDHLKALQLPEQHVYFNAGVLLLNLKVLRDLRLLEIVKEWTQRYLSLMINSDQDVLNAILAGSVSYFDLRWNLQAPLIAPIKLGWKCSTEHVKAVSDPGIIHYVSYRKPWRKEFKLPYQSLYFKYLAQTPWKDDEIDPFTADLVWQRCQEELEWRRKLVMSKIRRLIGRRFILSDDPN
jgi:lipopolysaccharide biosynthesis glycosyltransferase